MHQVWRLQFAPKGVIFKVIPSAGRCTGNVRVIIHGNALSDGKADLKEVLLGGVKADVMAAAADGRSMHVWHAPVLQR